jgi:hypothetical protein
MWTAVVHPTQGEIMSPPTPPTWKHHFDTVFNEIADATDLDVAKVHLAEEALFARWQELANGSRRNHAGELNEMKRASEKLLSVKTDQLGWPTI